MPGKWCSRFQVVGWVTRFGCRCIPCCGCDAAPEQESGRWEPVLRQAFGEVRRPTVLRPTDLVLCSTLGPLLLAFFLGRPVPAAASNPYGQVWIPFAVFAYLFRAGNCVFA